MSHAVVTDPVEGGSANDYDYVSGDPVNSVDLDGLCKKKKGIGIIRNAFCHGGNVVTKNRVAKAVGGGARGAARGVVKVGSETISAVDTVMDIYDAATGRWRRAVVSYVGGIAVTSTCAAGVIVVTGGIGVVGTGACVTAGVAAGEFFSSRVRDG